MPAQFIPTPYDAIATTLPDTDALASIIAVWAGGKMNLPEDILEILLAASYRCDHLIAHPKVSAQADHQGHRLHTWGRNTGEGRATWASVFSSGKPLEMLGWGM
jgi:hypothetical protein